MSRDPLQDFWTNIQYAHRFMPPLAISKPSRLTHEEVKKEFRLTAHTAEGFQKEAFSSLLSNDEVERLDQAVKGVREVAAELTPGTLATPEQTARALPHFQAIVDILAPDRFANPEAFKTGKQIEAKLKARRPAKLDHLRFMTGLDSTGDPALWIWAYTKEKDSGEYDQEAFFAAVDEIAPALQSAAEEVAPDRWPYISYRSTLDRLAYEAAA